MPEYTYLELAAYLYGCEPGEILKWRETPAGIVIIAPTGQKFTYTFAQLEAVSTSIPAKIKAQLIDAGIKKAPSSSTSKKKKP